MKCTILPIITGATETVTKDLKKNLEVITRKKFSRFSKTENYTWNITHFMESTATCNWNPEPLSSPLVQKKY